MDGNEIESANKLLSGPLGELLRTLAGPLATEIGETLGVCARHYRFRVALRMLEKTQTMVEQRGLDPHAVPPRLFLPILEKASVEDDEDLHSRWAALLANACVSDSVHPSFIEVLGQLAPLDARLLDHIYDLCEVQKNLQALSGYWGAKRIADALGVSEDDLTEPYQNLFRLGLLETDYEVPNSQTEINIQRAAWGKIKIPSATLKTHERMSAFAARFVRVCRPPMAPSVVITQKPAS